MNRGKGKEEEGRTLMRFEHASKSGAWRNLNY